MKHPYPVKGKNRLDFGFRSRENVILPRFLLTKGKNRAILGFQQAFLSWLYLRQYYRGHSMQVMEIQRVQSGGSVFGRVFWNVASRAFTNTVASERTCVQLYCASRGRADFRLPQPGSSQRGKGECSSPRLRVTWLFLRVTWPGHVRRTWLVRIFLLYGTLQGGTKHPCQVKGKNRLDFGFHPRENVILPRFWLLKGKNRAILGFQQAFLSWLPIPR